MVFVRDFKHATDQDFARIDSFVQATRQAVHVRREDQLLMIRPEKTMGINETAMEILSALYDRNAPDSRQVLDRLARRYRVPQKQVACDAVGLLESISAMMRDDFRPRANVRQVGFDRNRIKYPVLAEIALTYACQNRCIFCYAASPKRGPDGPVMTTDQVKVVIRRIAEEAHVPTLSFTGGEATLRKDLAQLIEYGTSLGLRVNLITNGLRASDPRYAKTLVDHGLASAQVSIEAGEEKLHDAMVDNPGAFRQTIAGIKAFRDLGIHVHTNSTVCSENYDHAEEIVQFVATELGLRTMSMNMLIRTGLGLDPSMQPVTYAQVAQLLPRLLDEAKRRGIKFVWYSPVPYCVVNPVLLGQGAKSCACVSGILSVNPAGQVLPCSSFQQGLGSLIDQPFDEIYNSPAAKYWREREYVPPPCRHCEDVDLCAGACPLYWDSVQSFQEIPVDRSNDKDAFRTWCEDRTRGMSFGVPCPTDSGSASSHVTPESATPIRRLPLLHEKLLTVAPERLTQDETQDNREVASLCTSPRDFHHTGESWVR